MTAEPKDPRAELNKLAKLLAEDLFNTPEAELLQEATKDESLKQSGNMAKNAYQNALQAVGAKRLQTARVSMKSANNQLPHDTRPIDAAAAHKIIAKMIASNDSRLTLAARNLDNASDVEAIEWVMELYELGAIDKDV
jgi:hypothetical protein